MKNTIVGAICALATFNVNAQQDITLEDIWASRKFSQDYVYGLRSMNDGAHFTTILRGKEASKIVKIDYATRKDTTVLFTTNQSNNINSIGDYHFSADENKMIISTNTEAIYRHSSRSDNFIYNLADSSIQFISKDGKQMYATFSPSGNKIGYVRANNLYILDAATGGTIQVTEDGEYNNIINGATDWVYEEEFSMSRGFFWNKDGSKIAFYKFDESEVKEMNMPIYGGLYPEDYKFKYPKAGEKNSDVKVMVYDLDTKGTKEITSTNEDVEYIPRINWTANKDEVAVQTLNRHQNHFKITSYNTGNDQAKVIYSESNETYVEVTDYLTFTEEGKGFIISSEKSGFNHLYFVNLASLAVDPITFGEFDITNFYGIGEDGYAYYQSAEASPMQRHIYKSRLNGKSKKQLTYKSGTNNADFSTGMRYFINTHSSANTPNFISLFDRKGSEIEVLKSSTALNATLAELSISKKEFFQFETSYGEKLNAWMIKPANFNPTKKYPVLVTIYGGPGSQTVKDSWGGANYMWHQMLAQQGYVVVSVDNRGTGARGAEFKKATYLQLGKLETEDYIEFAKYLGTQEYIDAARIGIWGWSYGGFMASLSITKGADAYKTAIAVAPVTNWKFYDSIYTERYMQTPEENEEGYEQNSPVNFAELLKGENYLLIHGNADDNVHFQNSAEMVNALIKANKQYDFYMYPNRNHGIYGGNTRLHLYTKMTNFLTTKL